MQSVTFHPVPFSVGGVAHAKPAAMSTVTPSSSARRYGPEDASGFRPMFFSQDLPENEAEAQLRLDWDQAIAQRIAKAYAPAEWHDRGGLVDLTV